MTAAHEGPGILADSGSFTGMQSEVAKKAITGFAADNGFGKKQTTYRLRDS